MKRLLQISSFFLLFFSFLFASSINVGAQITFAEDGIHCICGLTSPGGITIIATGTAGPFTFQWSGPEGYASTEQSPEDMTVPGLYEVAVVNTYGCAVTDANGCTALLKVSAICLHKKLIC